MRSPTQEPNPRPRAPQPPRTREEAERREARPTALDPSESRPRPLITDWASL